MSGNVIPFRQPEPEHWVFQPDESLRSTSCVVRYIITDIVILLDAHQRQVQKRGAKFTEFGSVSGDIMIASQTTAGELMSVSVFQPPFRSPAWPASVPVGDMSSGGFAA